MVSIFRRENVCNLICFGEQMNKKENFDNSFAKDLIEMSFGCSKIDVKANLSRARCDVVLEAIILDFIY